jgi:hypothetical protein
MFRTRRSTSGVLGLRPGEIVEVRSAGEIMATLDDQGRLEALPFMPEMLQFCGKRFRVYKRADKSCDTVGTSPTHALRMANAVHLEGLRCDGAAHGGCQAQCLVFWKEAWLKRPDRVAAAKTNGVPSAGVDAAAARLHFATQRAGATDKVTYVCQATELVRATSPLRWWEPGQYVRDLWYGNVDAWTFVKTVSRATFNALQRLRGGRQFPSVEANCHGETPTGTLNLQPGELVRIKKKEEIFATLNQQGRNRGLYFDVEMLPSCGHTAVVKQRVDHIINEKTGEMMHFSNPCIMLEGVVCSGCLSRERLFCPRAIYSYWREIWLERVNVPARETAPHREPVEVPVTV